MKLTIYKGTKEIGGTLIEVNSLIKSLPVHFRFIFETFTYQPVTIENIDSATVYIYCGYTIRQSRWSHKKWFYKWKIYIKSRWKSILTYDDIPFHWSSITINMHTDR